VNKMSAFQRREGDAVLEGAKATRVVTVSTHRHTPDCDAGTHGGPHGHYGAERCYRLAQLRHIRDLNRRDQRLEGLVLLLHDSNADAGDATAADDQAVPAHSDVGGDGQEG
jgi:hypothetical protein